MGRIRVLGDSLINRIAAGEVVERPASVVKELVENSLDASARTVDVHVRGGGKRWIRVNDDGDGMDRDDALLALERHATSKLAGPRDLDAIATLGFRGEALPSIAAVSHMILRTAPATGEGTEIEVRGGRILSVRACGAPRGTTLEIDRLFSNVPARRKFLRSDNTELSHVVRLVTRFALSHPGVRFSLRHEDRSLLDAPRTDDAVERVRQVLGDAAASRMTSFTAGTDALVIHGFAGRPVDARPRRQGQHVFVNGRAVQDRALSHAISAAYGNTVAHGHHPDVVLFVEIDPASVDVNVHPQKTEVRFGRAGEVHDAVRDAVHAALSGSGTVPRFEQLRPEVPATDRLGAAAAALRSFEFRDRSRPRGTYGPSRDRVAPGGAPHVADPPAATLEPEPLTPASAPEPQLRALAQFLDSYIVAQDAEGLVIVDQHAAHERILFERFLAQAEANEVEVQSLMFPATVELAPHEMLVFAEESEEFRRLGVVAETFGKNTVRVDGIPALGGGVEAEALLRELLGTAASAKSAAAGVDSLRLRLVTTASCKAAVKIRHGLSVPGMQALLDDLFRCANPTTCPHGRPIVFKLPLVEIERAFRRR